MCAVMRGVRQHSGVMRAEALRGSLANNPVLLSRLLPGA